MSARVVRFGGNEIPFLHTHEITAKMGVNVSVALLKRLGFIPVFEEHTKVCWQASDFPSMCYALAKHVAGRASQ